MKIDLKVVKYHKLYLAISAFIIIISTVFFLTLEKNLSVDFKGGEILQLKYEKGFNKDVLNKTLDELEPAIPQLKSKRLQYSEGDTIVLRTEQLEEKQRENLLKTLNEKTGKYEIVKNDKVGPTIGKELTSNALKALLIGSILIVIYVTIRFEFIYAIGGIAALIHDVIATYGFTVLLGYEIDTPFIAAILTILGYSINDTIVVFDRIRENEQLYGDEKDYGEIMEESVNQVFVRSMYTATTTTLSVVMLLLFGGDTLRTFSMSLFLGMIFGTFSSVFLSSPLIYVLRRFRKPKKKKEEPTDEEEIQIINGFDARDKVLV